MNYRNSNTVIICGVVLALATIWHLRPSKSHRQPASANESLPAQALGPTLKKDFNLSASATPGSPSRKDELVKLIHETKECYASETCDFPNTDPKSYEIAIGQKIKELLKVYQSEFSKDAKYKTDTEKLAREFITLDDQFVQEVSLELLSDVAPSEENLKALAEGLNGTLDPLLVEQAMNEMKRYLGTNEEPQVHEFLQELLGNGSVFSSEKAVQGIFPFINPQSFPAYDKVARSLPPESSVGRDLRALLEEYRRQQAGG
jgi:hypothetical protein